MSENTADRWRLSKEVSVADLVAVAVAVGGVAIVYGRQVEQMQAQSQRLASIDRAIEDLRPTDARIARLEQVTVMQTTALDRIEAKLDRVIERKQ